MIRYIREYYRVPAYRGKIVQYRGESWRIVGTNMAHLKLRHAQQPKRRIVVHPTDKYLVYVTK